MGYHYTPLDRILGETPDPDALKQTSPLRTAATPPEITAPQDAARDGLVAAVTLDWEAPDEEEAQTEDTPQPEPSPEKQAATTENAPQAAGAAPAVEEEPKTFKEQAEAEAKKLETKRTILKEKLEKPQRRLLYSQLEQRGPLRKLLDTILGKTPITERIEALEIAIAHAQTLEEIEALTAPVEAALEEVEAALKKV